MIRFAWFGGLLTLLAIAACARPFDTSVVRYRLTAQVVVDGDTYVGSTVIEVAYTVQPEGLTPLAYTARARGEALPIDLGSRGLLLVTLSDPRAADGYQGADATQLPLTVFGIKPSDEKSVAALRESHAQTTIPISDFPLIVLLKTSASADAYTTVDFARPVEAFGPGPVSISMSIETTDDGVSRQLDEYGFVQELRKDVNEHPVERLGDPRRLQLGMFERGL